MTAEFDYVEFRSFLDKPYNRIKVIPEGIYGVEKEKQEIAGVEAYPIILISHTFDQSAKQFTDTQRVKKAWGDERPKFVVFKGIVKKGFGEIVFHESKLKEVYDV